MARRFTTDVEKVYSDIDKMAELKKKLIGWACSYCEQGAESIDTKELGEVVDMIKDLSEANKYCQEALYFESVTNAMDYYGEEEPRYGEVRGYNQSRNSRNGQYMSRSSSRPRMDYMPDMKEEQGKYFRAYDNFLDARRHYSKTHDMEAKEDMEAYGAEHVGDMIETIRDIWKDADPAFKKKMREDIKTLADEM